MFSLPLVIKASLALLVLSSASIVFAQQDDKKSDDNNDLSLLVTNYNALREERQGFFLVEFPCSTKNQTVYWFPLLY